MAQPKKEQAVEEASSPKLRIYFLPNLFTAGNLFCGFLALTKIVESKVIAPYPDIRQALFLILLACIFDLLDGRVARMGGAESPFGREFDSLADVVSFGGTVNPRASIFLRIGISLFSTTLFKMTVQPAGRAQPPYRPI